MGIFEITSKVQGNNGFSLKGASTQIEVCTRDYQTWCKKGKAPKTMQAEYDRVKKLAEGAEIEPSVVFKTTILETCTTADELAKAKEKHGLLKTAVTVATPESTTNLLASLGLLIPDETKPATDSAEPTIPETAPATAFADEMGLAPTTAELALLDQLTADETTESAPIADRVVPEHPLVQEYREELAQESAKPVSKPTSKKNNRKSA